MPYEVTLIRGDGVGPELAEAAKMCIEATGVAINWDEQDAGVDVMAKLGTPDPRQRDRIVPADQGCAQGPDHHPRRHRIPQRQRLPPPGAGPLRLRPPVQDLPRASGPSSRRPRSTS